MKIQIIILALQLAQLVQQIAFWCRYRDEESVRSAWREAEWASERAARAWKYAEDAHQGAAHDWHYIREIAETLITEQGNDLHHERSKAENDGGDD